jgi:hypothetical protein
VGAGQPRRRRLGARAARALATTIAARGPLSNRLAKSLVDAAQTTRSTRRSRARPSRSRRSSTATTCTRRRRVLREARAGLHRTLKRHHGNDHGGRGGAAHRGRRRDPDQRLGRRAFGARGAARAVERRFLAEGKPRGLTSVSVVGVGDRAALGASHLAHEGLLKRAITSALVDSPGLVRLAAEDKIEAYTLPQGVLSQIMRDMAAGRPGLITKTGLHTFVDPRQQGARQSPRTPPTSSR